MFTHIKNLPRIMVVCLMLLANLAWIVSSAQAEDELIVRITQVDTSQFPHVTAYVSVTNADGEPMEVEPSRLTLLENGVEMTPESITGVGETENPLTTMLVMDISGSMNANDKLEAAKDAARAYVRQMRPNDQAGLMTFNTSIKLAQAVTTDTSQLLNAIKKLKAKDDTAMYDALMQAIDELQPISGRKAIIVLTDGLDNRSQADAAQIIVRVESAGLSISTIGLGDPEHPSGALSGLDEAALSALAKTAGGVYGYANDSASLTQLYERYGRALQSEYAITYSSPSTLRDGVNRALSVSLATGKTRSAVAEGSVYNPGGLVPEVAQPASWGVFFGLLGVLLILLILPTVVGKFLATREGKSESRVKLHKETRPKRVKLKE
ncbi:MAG: VWA domain-containing protein [Anaerolineales bacterium]|nr:VWA domain-containing protein [Anaerolineales bacterium]